MRTGYSQGGKSQRLDDLSLQKILGTTRCRDGIAREPFDALWPRVARWFRADDADDAYMFEPVCKRGKIRAVEVEEIKRNEGEDEGHAR